MMCRSDISPWTTPVDDVSDAVRDLDGLYGNLHRVAVTLAGLMMEPPPTPDTRLCLGSAEYHVRELARAIENTRNHWAYAERKRPEPTSSVRANGTGRTATRTAAPGGAQS